MIWRLLATGTGLAMGYIAVLMSNCASVSLAGSPGPGLWTCLATDSPNGYPGVSVSAALGAVAAMLVALAWIPVFIRRRRNRIHGESSFGENLHRVADAESGSADSANTQPSEDVTPAETGSTGRAPNGLQGKVETIEQELTSGELSPTQVTTRWIGLLREANDLHNSGEMSTGAFKKVNTRLLELPSLLESRRAETHVG